MGVKETRFRQGLMHPTPLHLFFQQWQPLLPWALTEILPGNQKIKTLDFSWVAQRLRASLGSLPSPCHGFRNDPPLPSCELCDLHTALKQLYGILLFNYTRLSQVQGFWFLFKFLFIYMFATDPFKKSFRLFHLQGMLDSRRCCFLSFLHLPEEQSYQTFVIVTFPWKWRVRPTVLSVWPTVDGIGIH